MQYESHEAYDLSTKVKLIIYTDWMTSDGIPVLACLKGVFLFIFPHFERDVALW